MLSRLHVLLFGDEATSASTSETLESFMYRLHSRPAKERNAAVKVHAYVCLKREILVYNKLPWFVSKRPAEKDISNVVVQCK